MKVKICSQCAKTNPHFFEECYNCNKSLFGLISFYYPSGKMVSVMIDFIPMSGLFGLIFSFLNFQICMIEEEMNISFVLFGLIGVFYGVASIGTVLENKFCALFLLVLFFADQISSMLLISGASIWSFVWKASLLQGMLGVVLVGAIFLFGMLGAFQLERDKLEEVI